MGSLPSTIGPYRIIRQLGEGGMGTVLEAVHEVIQRRVAIKVLHPESGRSADVINRFVNEARATNLVGHPGLVQITDFGNLPDGSGYLVMEYLHGQTLAGRLRSAGGKLSPAETVHIGIQIAAAVAAVHQKDIIHRDLKPSNVMLVPEPSMPTGERLKVLDFGIAKLSDKQGASSKTNSQAIMGTPLYMSPEQCQGAGRVDVKSDVYSLGCMLYEMLSGQPPFTGDGPGEVIGQHLFKQPDPLGKRVPSTQPALAELVERMLDKSKEQRPSMREVQKALEDLAAAFPAPPRRQEPEVGERSDAAQIAPLAIHSTLGKAAAEAQVTQRRVLLAAVFVIVVMVTALTVALRWHSGARNSIIPPVVAVMPVDPLPSSATPAQVTLHIISQPAGAQIVQAADGKLLGTTPWKQQIPRSDEPLQVTLRLNHYVQRELILSRQRDGTADIKLVTSEFRRQPANTKLQSSPRSPPTAAPKPSPPVTHAKPIFD